MTTRRQSETTKRHSRRPFPTEVHVASSSLLSLYSAVTDRMGFGLKSDTQLRRDAELSGDDIVALQAAGLIRFEQIGRAHV